MQIIIPAATVTGTTKVTNLIFNYLHFLDTGFTFQLPNGNTHRHTANTAPAA
jgi:hypothetical protein